MPSRNILKTYVKDGLYHIYNRGVAKQKIFINSLDYNVFLKYIKESLVTPKIRKIKFDLKGRTFKGVPRTPKNFKGEIELLAYCIMPNHFHLLLKQKNKISMPSFMRSIITRYAGYFNKNHNRVGPLFQGRYKAVLVTKDEYILHLTRYIHLNPIEIEKDLTKAYSSYPEYLGLRKTKWIKPNFILKFFNNKTIPEVTKINNYNDFVENYKRDSGKFLGELTLE